MIEVITDNDDRFLMDDYLRLIPPSTDSIETFLRFLQIEDTWEKAKRKYPRAYHLPDPVHLILQRILTLPGVKSVIDLDPAPEEECPEFDEQGQLIIY